jgi:hypothetical protein
VALLHVFLFNWWAAYALFQSRITKNAARQTAASALRCVALRRRFA